MSSTNGTARAMESLDGVVMGLDLAASPQSTALVFQSQLERSGSATAKIPWLFDYDALEGALAEELRAHASRLRHRITKSTQELIEIGLDLTAAKIQLRHGQFVKWVEAEVGISRRTAQRYIAVAELAAKSVTVTLLTPTSAYLLSRKSLPDDVADAALQKVERGELLTDQEVEEFVRSHHQHTRMRSREQNLSNDAQQDSGQINEHDLQVVELDATSAAMALLEALGPKSARLVCETLARRPEAILAELQTLVSTRLSDPLDLSRSLGLPPASSAGPLETTDAQNRPAVRPSKVEWPDIPLFLDRRTSKQPDPIVAASRAKNSGPL
ncbi:DUF3102 domain-containing protein [Microvirga antarctica]|uniref:DUF3102 domain-containing protein n=1 Tax=Microvirga antarctica TaxID=2819233 RepID=UPI001B3080F6|nr:DUF3102 domain-containing protein [Microvirga antarctica]